MWQATVPQEDPESLPVCTTMFPMEVFYDQMHLFDDDMLAIKLVYRIDKMVIILTFTGIAPVAPMS